MWNKLLNKLNRVNTLSDSLRRKFESYQRNRAKKAKIREYFSWEEFTEVFCIVFCQWHFSYDGKILVLENFDNLVGFCIEDPYSYQKYSSPKELLENAMVNGKTLGEIWNQLDEC